MYFKICKSTPPPLLAILASWRVCTSFDEHFESDFESFEDVGSSHTHRLRCLLYARQVRTGSLGGGVSSHIEPGTTSCDALL